MSSFVRTLEKRILKAKGYLRQTRGFRISKITKEPEIFTYPKGGGPIQNSDGISTGRSTWPTPVSA